MADVTVLVQTDDLGLVAVTGTFQSSSFSIIMSFVIWTIRLFMVLYR